MAAGPVNLHRVDQVCVVVRDLDQALERYWTQLGIGPWRIYTYGSPLVKDTTYRGKPTDYHMRLAMAKAGDLNYELIQPLDTQNIYHEFLEAHGEGLHHLGIFVPSLEAGTRRLEALGYNVIQSGRGYGLHGDGAYAYFDTDRTLGAILELIELPTARHEPEAIYPPG